MLSVVPSDYSIYNLHVFKIFAFPGITPGLLKNSSWNYKCGQLDQEWPDILKVHLSEIGTKGIHREIYVWEQMH